jgi:hypothetical protein
MRRLRSRDDVVAGSELASAPDALVVLGARCPIMLRTWEICSSSRCRCDSNPWSAASRISLFGVANVFAMSILS